MSATASSRPRWPYFGRGQKLLVGCGLAMWLGSALPWLVIRPFGFWARATPLVVAWILWAGLMTLAGAVAPWKVAVLISAVGGGGTAVYLGGWQLLRIGQRCPLGSILRLECVPGPGLFLVFAAGIVALWQAWRILRPATGPP